MQGLLPYVINGISAGGQYALIAIGYTLVYGILRLINFAHGDVFMVAGLIMVYASASLPMYLAIAAGMAFSAAVWAVVALAAAAWSPDKLLSFTIPSFLYYLWAADAPDWFLGLKIPHPASLFNDGLSAASLKTTLIGYGVLFAVSLAAYYAGCERRLRHA